MTTTETTPVTTPVPEAGGGDVEHLIEEEHGHGHHTSTGVTNEKLAMWAFLGSECLLFGGLISVFLIYRTRPIVRGLPVDEFYDIPFTSVSSFVLLMSSLTMVLALAALNRGDQRANRIWLLTTALLGSIFVGGQVLEFTKFVREGLGYTTNLQSSAFYTLTGFHGVHVTMGILMLLSLFVLSLRGKLGQERSETVEIIGLYWHFVDVVWILIFTLVYLIKP